MAYQLSPEDLQVTSFSTAESDASVIGGNTVYPFCIVYVSDCVSCPPDMDRIEY